MGFAHAPASLLPRFLPSAKPMTSKHSLTIAGHATSLTLEPIFWEALKAAADAEGKPLAALVAEIDEARSTNLSSAVRVWLFKRATGAESD
jgi:predicted DNA-binding ribbon-helix-helix protein